MTTRIHQHPEAFCLMTYSGPGVTEVIWNSRDGVTPFILRSKSGVEMQHVNWSKDVYAPAHVPKVGDRVFEDQTVERVREWRTKYVDANYEFIKEDFPNKTKDEMIAILVEGDMREFDGHAPQVTEVTEEWLKKRAAIEAAKKGET